MTIGIIGVWNADGEWNNFVIRRIERDIRLIDILDGDAQGAPAGPLVEHAQIRGISCIGIAILREEIRGALPDIPVIVHDDVWNTERMVELLDGAADRDVLGQ